jgi:hypothetical protein
MGIVKEWRCLAHGSFESDEDEPACPRGCTTVEREFRTAPGLTGFRTRSIDASLKQIASDFGLSEEQLRARFGKLPSTKEGGVPAALQQMGAPPTNAVEQARPLFLPPQVVRIQDPEKLSLPAA